MYIFKKFRPAIMPLGEDLYYALTLPNVMLGVGNENGLADTIKLGGEYSLPRLHSNLS